MKKFSWAKLMLMCYLALLLLYFIGFEILEQGGVYHRTVKSLYQYLLVCLPFFYILYIGIRNLYRYKKRYPQRSIGNGLLLLIAYIIVSVGILGFLAGRNYGIYNLGLTVKYRFANTKVPERQSEQPDEKSRLPENRPYEKVEEAWRRLYEEVFSMTYPSCEEKYNAKGNFYVLLQEGKEEYECKPDVPYRITVVYDRCFDDNSCQIFNHYKIYMTEEGEVTAFGLRYYVDMASGAITAEEVPWGD